jgi:hypothetical protein
MTEALDCGNDYITANNVAKAWVNYDQDTPTIRDSFNVDSVTDNSTGDFTVNWSTNFANVNYAIAAMAGETNGNVALKSGFGSNQLVGSATLRTYSTANAAFDCESVTIMAMGDE